MQETRDAVSIPGSGRSPGGGQGNPLQYSCLENPMDRGAWRAMVHGVTKSQTWLNCLSTKRICKPQVQSELCSCSFCKHFSICGLWIIILAVNTILEIRQFAQLEVLLNIYFRYKCKDVIDTKQAIKRSCGDFSSGPVAKTPRAQCRGPRSDPWSGELDPTCCNLELACPS